MIDPVWQLAHRSLDARLRNGDLKETWLAEEWVGAVARSRAFSQSADHGFKDGIVFAGIQTRQWTLQCLHNDKLGEPLSDQLLPMRCGKCVMRIEEKDVLNAVCIGDLIFLWARLVNSKANVRVEVHVEQEGSAVQPVIMSTCRCVKS